MAYFELLISVFLFSSTVYSYSISTQSQTIYKKKGEEVTLGCEIVGDDYNSIRTLLTWKKMQDKSTTMLTLLQYGDAFSDRNRFPEVNEEQGPSTFAINPVIRNLMVEDSGMYTCEAGDQKVTHTLWVLEEISDLVMWSYPDKNDMKQMSEQVAMQQEKLTFHEDQEAFIECKADGGVPPPTLSISDSGSDRRISLTSHSDHKYEGNVEGLKKPMFSTTLNSANVSFSFNREADGQTLTCEATIADKEEYKKSVSRKIEMLYKPHFREGDCKSTQTTRIGSSKKVACKFIAKPLPLVLEWKNIATGISTPVDAQIIGDSEYEAYLIIEEVTESDLGSYSLMVENSIGKNKQDITLLVGDDTSGSTGSASVITVSLLTVLLNIMLSFAL